MEHVQCNVFSGTHAAEYMCNVTNVRFNTYNIRVLDNACHVFNIPDNFSPTCCQGPNIGEVFMILDVVYCARRHVQFEFYRFHHGVRHILLSDSTFLQYSIHSGHDDTPHSHNCGFMFRYAVIRLMKQCLTAVICLRLDKFQIPLPAFDTAFGPQCISGLRANVGQVVFRSVLVQFMLHLHFT